MEDEEVIVLGFASQDGFHQALHVPADAGVPDSAEVEGDSHQADLKDERLAAAETLFRARSSCHTWTKMECAMAWWTSSIICMESQGTTAQTSHSDFILP